MEDRQDLSGLATRMIQDLARGHVIVPFWSAHQVTIGMLALARFGWRAALKHFEIVADDSFAGEIMWQMGERLDLSMRRIHTRGNAKRLEDVAAWMRDPKPFFIAVDGGSTYGTVPTGIVRMAARLGSAVWPIAVRTHPSMHVPGFIAELPLPGASVAVGIANAVRIDRGTPIAHAATDIKQRLDTATAAAGAVLRGTPRPVLESVWMGLERAS